MCPCGILEPALGGPGGPGGQSRVRRVAQGVGPPASGALSPSLSMASLDTAPSCPVGHLPTPSSMRGEGRERKGVRRSSERVRGQSGPGRGGARRVSARSRARGREFRSRRRGWPRAPQQPRQKGKKLKQSGAGTGDCRGGRCRERPPEVLSPTLTTVSLPWREPSSQRTRQGKGRVSGRAAFTRSFSKL